MICILTKLGNDISINMVVNKEERINLLEIILCMLPLFIVLFIIFILGDSFEKIFLNDLKINKFILLLFITQLSQFISPIYFGLKWFKQILLINIFCLFLSFSLIYFNDYRMLDYYLFYQLVFTSIITIHLFITKKIYIAELKFKNLIVKKGIQKFSVFQISNNLILKMDVLFLKFFTPNLLGIYTTIKSLHEVFYYLPRSYSSLQINAFKNSKSPIKNDKIILSVLWLFFLCFSFFVGNLFFDGIPSKHIDIYLINGFNILVYSWIIVMSFDKLYENNLLVLFSLLIGIICQVFCFYFIYILRTDNLVYLQIAILLSYFITFLILSKKLVLFKKNI